MEEFIVGDIYTYDAICDRNGDPLFESSLRCVNVADSINNGTECVIFVMPDMPAQLRDYGRRTLKAFNVKSRFVHFEFFRLTEARKGLAEAGEFAGLEVNMRPAGGFIPDMMNFSHSTDVYQIWADMIGFGQKRKAQDGADRWCAYVGTKDTFSRVPDVFSEAMGNQLYMALLDTEDEVREYVRFILDEQAESVIPGLYR